MYDSSKNKNNSNLFVKFDYFFILNLFTQSAPLSNLNDKHNEEAAK
jgi:hypothetical protein